MITEKEYYRPDEVAAIFDISIASIYRLMRRYEIECIRVGRSVRISREEVKKIQQGKKWQVSSKSNIGK